MPPGREGRVLEPFVDCLGWQFHERKRSVFLMAIQLLDFVFVRIGVPSLRGVHGWCAVPRVVFSAGFALVLYWLEREISAKRETVFGCCCES